MRSHAPSPNPTRREVESGCVYLVHRENPDGQIESAFWRATVDGDRIEFAPVTRDAKRNERGKFTTTRESINTEDVFIGGLLHSASFLYA